MAEGIIVAATPADFAAFSGLITEYVEWCRGRYSNHRWFIDRVFDHQSLADEQATLSSAYSAPNGKALLFVRDGQVCGGGAYRQLGEGACEMKRLFVPDRFKGQGVGARLCEALIASAREDGYAVMRLDTGNLFAEAISLYESFGFQRCAPYREYPPELMDYLVFMELPLKPAS